jgi:hypothetical protein
MPEIDLDRLCIRCQKGEIMGKPYTVYVCWECYFFGRCDCGYVKGSPACQALHDGGGPHG